MIPQYAIHDIRRILPNFMELKSTRNTGLWSSDATMKRLCGWVNFTKAIISIYSRHGN